ncbi:GNAT family N-acetyltransferase [Herbaspirillum sp. HC18]|nr:GNAT family N-acetyltransferase [Herbaspirillum sp. HC18]
MKALEFEENGISEVATRPLSAFHYVGKNEFLSLEKSWCALEEKTGGPIEQFDWATASAECTNASQIELVGVMRGEELSAVVPLAIKPVSGIKRRMMLGVDEYFEPMDFLSADSESLDRLMHELASDSRPMFLTRLPSESGSLAALRSIFKNRALMIERPGASFPFIPLDESWSVPEAHLNSGRRSDLRRMRRRLDKLGQSRAEIVTPKLEQLDALLDKAFQVEARSWKGLTGSALLFDKKRQTHLRKYLRSATADGKLRIGFLCTGSQAIAMQIAIEHADALWLLKIGYDSEFSHCSPGQLLLRDMIEYAAKAHLKRFEFLGVSESWIDVWTPHKRESVSVRIYPFSVEGALALTIDASARLMRAIGSGTKEARRLIIHHCAVPILKRAAKSYISGEKISDALRVAAKLNAEGRSATIGYWNTESCSPNDVADQGLLGLEQLTGYGDKNYLSLKLPALQFNKELLYKLGESAATANRRLHLDAHGIECVDRKIAACEDLKQRHPNLDIGFTLPGRWERSLKDADWVCRQGHFVRVVKGQWPDPAKADHDPERGFLNVIDRLAGRARMVAVATHDPELAFNALQRLQAAGTPCELELLYGLPMRRCLQVARQLGVSVRIYVPYGEAYLPYALSQLRRKPQILWWLLRDSVTAMGRRS